MDIAAPTLAWEGAALLITILEESDKSGVSRFWYFVARTVVPSRSRFNARPEPADHDFRDP